MREQEKHHLQWDIVSEYDRQGEFLALFKVVGYEHVYFAQGRDKVKTTNIQVKLIIIGSVQWSAHDRPSGPRAFGDVFLMRVGVARRRGA